MWCVRVHWARVGLGWAGARRLACCKQTPPALLLMGVLRVVVRRQVRKMTWCVCYARVPLGMGSS
jgi:hypothetical protein